jgi:hypothetical protein
LGKSRSFSVFLAFLTIIALRTFAIELFRGWPETLSESPSAFALDSMKCSEFEDHILASGGSNNEARNASTGILSILCSSDPLRYLHQICAAILDSNRPDVQITSITILLSQIRSVGAFLDPHIVSQFWIARFLPAIPTILAMQSVPEHIRRVALDFDCRGDPIAERHCRRFDRIAFWRTRIRFVFGERALWDDP